MNNIDSLIDSLKRKEILEVNKKLNQLFNETKDYIAKTYIYNIKYDPLIQLELDNEIKAIIDKIIDDNKENFENIYNEIMNSNIQNCFIEEYNKVLNEESENMMIFINTNKNLIKLKLDSLNIIKIDDIQLDIENKLNNTKKSIDNYILFFDNFKMKGEISELLNNYCKDTILPNYKAIKFILDNSTKDIVVHNLEENVFNLKNNYIIQNVISKSNNISNNLKNLYFYNITNYIKYSYGSISSVYLQNLDKEISFYQNIRRLDELKIDTIYIIKKKMPILG